MEREQFEKQCYFIARHSKEYLADGSFNNRLAQIIMTLSKEEQASFAPLMEGLISRGKAYEEADEKYAPILIYYQDPVCYGVLNYFADCMKKCLEDAGETVETFDLSARPLDDLLDLMGQKFKAVIGFQTYAFSIRLKNCELLHDHIIGPKFNMLLDHPVTFTDHFKNSPKSFYVLTHDRTYQKYILDNFPEVSGCFILPPGGTVADAIEMCGDGISVRDVKNEDKIYDISFVGTFSDTRMCIMDLLEANRKTNGMARKLMKEMKYHPNETLEEALSRAAGEELDADRFRQLSHDLRSVYLTVMFFYREQIVRAILDAGIRLDVFGDSWKNSKLLAYAGKNLIIHDAVSPKENADVFAKSKLSLNIMSWHKDGMTERIAGIMLNGAVLVSDKSMYLTEKLSDGENVILFDLEEYHKDGFKGVADRIKSILLDDIAVKKIAANAYETAIDEFTWERRTRQFVQLLQSVE